MKNKKFKCLKKEAVKFLSKIPIENFNRFSKSELAEALGKNYVERESFRSTEDLTQLLSWAFKNFRPIKMNTPNHIFDIRIERFKNKEGYYVNNIRVDVKHTARKAKRDFLDHYILATEELDVIDDIYHMMCFIFESTPHTPRERLFRKSATLSYFAK